MRPLDYAGFVFIAVARVGGVCMHLWLIMKRRR
jgi:hypothetical protein